MKDLKISVIICTYNRANFLFKCLNSLNNQTANKSDFEVVVVDNNSSDNTKEVCLNFINNNPELNLSYTIEPKQGLSFARNKGIEVAKADIISYIDDDAIAKENFVENLIIAFDRNPEYKALGGRIEPIYEQGDEPLWMSRYTFGIVSKVDYGNTEKEFPKKFPTGCNMAFRKDILKEIGGFNVDLVYRSDEKYVFKKLTKKNIKILYAPDVFVNHFIEALRTTPEHVDKISRAIGASEKLRLQSEPYYNKLLKTLEYFIKFNGAIILFVLFTLKGQYPKGKYAIKVILQTIIGYYSKKDYAKL